MFRIRRIHDDVLPLNKQSIAAVQQLLAAQFPGLDKEETEALPERLRNPFKRRFRTILYVAENARQQLIGCAVLLLEPKLQFAWLDYVATAQGIGGRGIGAALYQHVQEEARAFAARGLFFECLPDDPDRCRDPEVRKTNAARLRFYERYGAYPIVNTAYETPVRPGDDDNVPHLVYDPLVAGQPLAASFARRVVRAVLERKYGDLCSPRYIGKVVRSFVEDPVALRPPRYGRNTNAAKSVRVRPTRPPVVVFVNDKHSIHHVRERGYVESPVRVDAILGGLRASGLVEVGKPRTYPLKHLAAVHDGDYLQYFRRTCAKMSPGKSVYPYVFPIRNAARPPKDLSVRAGYYCIDTFTPINGNAYAAAIGAVDCSLSGADALLTGRRLAYALVRPPGHHAERRAFGGFCYFNNAAVAAHYLSAHGTVAMLDIDYHHGNGQQDIFYERADILTLSIHGDPAFAYPYFSGFADERGTGPGEGFNVNIPLPEAVDGPQYQRVLGRALAQVRGFDPAFLIVALGFDPAKGDPTGTWSLSPTDFETCGNLIGALRRPTLVVQEGGYRTRTLGTNAVRFFTGLASGANHL